MAAQADGGFHQHERVKKGGPGRMAGAPFRGNEPVLTPMYAEISWRSPPSRPFLNLLCFFVHLPVRCLVRALLDCPPLLSAHCVSPAASTVNPHPPTTFATLPRPLRLISDSENFPRSADRHHAGVLEQPDAAAGPRCPGDPPRQRRGRHGGRPPTFQPETYAARPDRGCSRARAGLA